MMVFSALPLWLFAAAHLQHVPLPESDVLFECKVANASSQDEKEISCLALRHPEGAKIILSLSSSTVSLHLQEMEKGKGILGHWILPGNPSKEKVLELRRKSDRLSLRVDGCWIGEVNGIQGAGGIVTSTGTAWKLLEQRVQPLSKISFSDDFMREEGTQGAWEFPDQSSHQGWSLEASHHPGLSAAPFCFRGQAQGETMALAGHDFWDNYAFQSSVRAESPGTSVGLVFSWKKPSCYHLLEWTTQGSNKEIGTLSLYRMRPEQKELLAERKGSLPMKRWFSLCIAQTGPRVVCGVGGVAMLEAKDPCLTGGKIGLHVAGGTALFDDVEARSIPPGASGEEWLDNSQRTHPHVPQDFLEDEYMKAWATAAPQWAEEVLPQSEGIDYTFYKAPVDWVPAAGSWRVAQRWVCLPRFTWMRGDGEELSLLWHAWRFEGDIAAEVTCANAMTGRPMPHYDWGVNRCISICADRSDPLTGYTFIWGGPDFKWKLVRNGTIVAETDAFIERDFRHDHNRLMKELHKNWTTLMLSKKKGHVEALLDGKPLLTFDDAEPLTGGNMAIWAWRHPLLLARVRIAYQKATRPSWNELDPKKPPGVLAKKFPLDSIRVRKDQVLSFEVKPAADSSLHLLLETNAGQVGVPLCGDTPVHPSLPTWGVERIPRDQEWHTVEISLLEAFESLQPWTESWEVLESTLLDWGTGHRYIPWMGWKTGEISLRNPRIVHKDKEASLEMERIPPSPILQLEPDPRFFTEGFDHATKAWKRYGCDSGARPVRLPHPGRLGEHLLRAINEEYGGCFGLRVPCPAYDSAQFPWICFDGRLGPAVRINLLAQIEGTWEQMTLSGVSPFRKPFGKVSSVEKEEHWCKLTAHLGEDFVAARKPCRPPIIQGLAFSDVGLWSHVSGDYYDLDDFQILSEIPSDIPIHVTPEAEGAVGFQAALQGPQPEKTVSLEQDEAGVFHLPELSPGRYELTVWSLGRHGFKSTPAETSLFIREPWNDEEAPTLSSLSHQDKQTYGDKTLRFKLDDSVSGVNLSSVRLTVNGTSYGLSDKTLTVLPCSGEWTWEGNRLGKDIYDGPVSCELSCEDLAGNSLSHRWQWVFSSLYDHQDPTIAHLSTIPAPFAVWQDFETGPEGWHDFDNIIVDWGGYTGPCGDEALHYRQPRGGGLHAGTMGIPSFSARQWPCLRFDALVQEGGQPSILARVNNADWKIRLAQPVTMGQWSTVQVDLESALDRAGLKTDDLRVEFLTLQFEKTAAMCVDNVCLFSRHPRTATVRWAEPEDATGVSLYRWSCSEQPDGPISKGELTEGSSVDLPIYEGSPCFLHLQARDGAGNWGPVFHQRIVPQPPELLEITAEEFR